MRAKLELPHLSIVHKDVVRGGDVLFQEQSISNKKVKGYA